MLAGHDGAGGGEWREGALESCSAGAVFALCGGWEKEFFEVWALGDPEMNKLLFGREHQGDGTELFLRPLRDV